MPENERLALRFRPLFRLTIRIDPVPQAVGEVPLGTRRIVVIAGGDFSGERLRGEVLPGASAAWVLVRPDGVVDLSARVTLRTDDGAEIYMHYPGMGHGPPEVMARVNAGQAAEPGAYYFRIAPRFETAAPQYAWLNKLIAVGVGERAAAGPVYEVYEIL